MLTTIDKPDDQIQAEVIQELRWDCRTERSAITVSVKDAAVTLNGRVKYFAIRRAAIDAANRIAGVRSLIDNLEVHIPCVEFRGNCEIADAVRDAFAWNVLVPEERLSVVVNAGVVTITGTVECITQREEAEQAVVNLLGVRGIDNRITVQEQPILEESVCTEIRSSLERQSLDSEDRVKVTLDEGAVLLSGTVPNWSHRSAAISAASLAHGVRRVVDDLKVAATA